ncbi:MAG: STAS domain-containing protein [Thermochromatium sp.]
MNAQSAPSSDPERLRLSGELTIYTVAETLTRLRAHLAEHHLPVLDLSEVTEIDGAGLQLLLWLRETARARGIALRLVAPSPAVCRVLELLQLHTRFDLDSVGATVGETR